MVKVEIVKKHAATKTGVSPHGEGPHWDDTTNTLLYVDILANGIHRLDPETNTEQSITLDENVGFAVPARKGGLIAGVGLSVAHVEWDNKKVTALHRVNEDPRSRFNDGKCDPKGRVWGGTMGPQPDANDLGKMDMIGHLYSMDMDGSLTDQLDKIGISNGLAWTQDSKTMYYIDSIPRKIYAFDYDIDKGSVANQRTVIEYGAPISEMGVPDGMTIDNEGKLWVACYYGSQVLRFDPETGKQLQSIKLPSRRVTSCCFGGKNFDELYITTSIVGADEAELKSLPNSGSIFKATELGVRGFPAAMYEGDIKV